ncbi:hypothetical protein ABZ461_31705, partial [Actinacidiphila glaucinigra]
GSWKIIWISERIGAISLREEWVMSRRGAPGAAGGTGSGTGTRGAGRRAPAGGDGRRGARSNPAG